MNLIKAPILWEQMKAALLGERSFEVISDAIHIGDYLYYSCKDKPGWEYIRQVIYTEKVVDAFHVAGLGPISAHYNTIAVEVDYGQDKKEGILSNASYFYQLYGRGIDTLVRVKFPGQTSSTMIEADRVTVTGIHPNLEFLDLENKNS